MGSNPNGSDSFITHYKNAKGFIRWKTPFFKIKKASQKKPCNEIIPGSLKSSAVCIAGFQYVRSLNFFLD